MSCNLSGKYTHHFKSILTIKWKTMNLTDFPEIVCNDVTGNLTEIQQNSKQTRTLGVISWILSRLWRGILRKSWVSGNAWSSWNKVVTSGRRNKMQPSAAGTRKLTPISCSLTVHRSVTRWGSSISWLPRFFSAELMPKVLDRFLCQFSLILEKFHSS